MEPVTISSVAEFEQAYGPRPRVFPPPSASRVIRRRFGRWDAWALFPDPAGPWFLVGRALTRRGAQRLLRSFMGR